MLKTGLLALLVAAGCTGADTDLDSVGSTAQAVSGPTTTAGARVGLDFLRGATPYAHDHDAERGGHHHGSGAGSHGVPGVDSVANFTGSFTAPGFDSAGNPQSVWPYSMVGAPPSQNRMTRIKAPVVPVTIELLDASGAVATSSAGSPLRMVVGNDTIDATMKSPVFNSFAWNSGTGQYTDQMMRTQFWNQFPHHFWDDESSGYHTVLQPSLKPARTIQLAFGTYRYAEKPDGSCCAFILADIDAFSNQLFPPTTTDTTTVLGSVEHSGDASTRDITTLLFKDVFLYDGDPANCCILGYHSYDAEPGDASNGNRERRYVMDFASFISPGLFSFGFQDVTAFSHEMAELFADPFVDNWTPWWLTQDPVLGSSLCQNNLETGDVVEVLNQPVHAVPMNGRTYHPSNEALLPWFSFQFPSTARAGAYSFPDETLLSSPPQPNLNVGCVP